MKRPRVCNKNRCVENDSSAQLSTRHWHMFCARSTPLLDQRSTYWCMRASKWWIFFCVDDVPFWWRRWFSGQFRKFFWNFFEKFFGCHILRFGRESHHWWRRVSGCIELIVHRVMTKNFCCLNATMWAQ